MTTNRPVRRGCWPLSVAMAGLMAVSTAAAPPRPAVEVENLRVGFAAGDRNNLFKVGAWVPVWVQLRAGAERFSGTLEVVVPDDDGVPTSSRLAIDLAPGEGRRFTAYARAGTMDPDFDINVYDSTGRRRAHAPGTSLATVTAQRPGEVLLLTLGKPQGVELIPTLPSFAADKATPGGEVTRRAARPGGRPAAGAVVRLRRGAGRRARHQRRRRDGGAGRPARPGPDRLGPPRRAPGRRRRRQLAEGPRQRSLAPDPAGAPLGHRAGHRPRGPGVVLRVDQADHAPRLGGAGRQARRDRQARRQGVSPPGPSPWSSAARTGSAG